MTKRMRTCMLAAASAALITAAGTTPASGASVAAGSGAPTLPVLGHWRNGHPGDVDTAPGWLLRMQRAEAAYGDFEGHWRNYHPPGDPPMNGEEIAAARRGEKLHISWRPRPEGESWAYTASGAYDDTIEQVMRELKRHCGGDCWLSIDVEPENDVDETPGSGFTTADFRGMWHRVAAARERVGADNVKLVWVLQGFEKFRPLYPGLWPGNDEVDIVGHDPYINKNEAPERLGEKMVDRTRFLVESSDAAHDFGSKPQLIAEYGCDINNIGDPQAARGTDGHRAACLDGVRARLGELAGLGVVEMEIFDARSDWLNDPPAVDGVAYRRLKQASEAG